jgi:YHS domain-containing protein
VLRYALLVLLLIFVARAFWKVFDGIMEAAGATSARRRRPSPVKLVKDPVCGTFVAPDGALSLAAKSGTKYFCSDACRQAYQQRR